MSDYLSKALLKFMIDKHKSQYADFEGENKNSKLRKKLILKGYNEYEQIIEQIPTADVAEVKHGKWESEWSIIGNALYFHCSVCGESDPWQHTGRGPASYCPRCGAKMDGGEEE
ncbi:MAG: hypothetical protein IJC09_06230 [Clostridia bacterium]|nr:hypothetical protein [Clostridia bacterium]